MIASQNGNIEVLDTLIKHGANVDFKKEVNLFVYIYTLKHGFECHYKPYGTRKPML